MTNLLFSGILALALGLIYYWGFKRLSHERWQILGAIPLYRRRDGTWRGLNLTYYGLINACSVTSATLLVALLLSAVGLSLPLAVAVETVLLLLLLPLAKLIAHRVEKKKHTVSIGGTACVGFIAAPALLWIAAKVASVANNTPLPVMEVISALAVGYTLGEGSGRLACISFGCCYGKPIRCLPTVLQRWLGRWTVTYYGDLKKAAYAHDLAGEKTLAVPGFTVVLYSAAAIIGVYLFLEGRSAVAYLVCVLVTQIWRFISEFLRADYRGTGRISTYQYLSLAAIVASMFYYRTLPHAPYTVELLSGLTSLWNPWCVLGAQMLWLTVFLYLGRSQVTTAIISFHVRRDHI